MMALRVVHPDDLLAALNIIEREGPSFGLHLNRSKSLLFIPPCSGSMPSNSFPPDLPTVQQVIFESSKFRGCSIHYIFESQIFAGRGILTTPTKWRRLVALRWMACWCGHAH